MIHTFVKCKINCTFASENKAICLLLCVMVCPYPRWRGSVTRANRSIHRAKNKVTLFAVVWSLTICVFGIASRYVEVKRKAPAFPIRTKQKIMSFFSLITPQFQYIDLYLWRKTRLKVSHLHECPVLCIRIFFPRRCRWVDVMLPFQGVVVGWKPYVVSTQWLSIGIFVPNGIFCP